MRLGSSNILGIALSDRAAACVELASRGDRRSLRRTGTFTAPPDVTLEKPDALGQALAQFLRANGFGASRVVVGVPARWLIALDRDVPPADEQAVRATLRLQAERLSIGEGNDTVFDYAGNIPVGKAGKVLLVGILRKQLDRIEQAMEAAGLSVLAVTSTGLTLASLSGDTRGTAMTSGAADVPVLMLTRGGVEVVLRQAGTPRLLRHVSFTTTNGHGTPNLTPLGAELRRTVALAGGPPGSSGAAAKGDAPAARRELLLWDAVGLTEPQVSELSDRLNVTIRPGDGLRSLGVDSNVITGGGSGGGSNGADAPERYAAATALAVAGARRDTLPLDFAHSRLTPMPKRRVGRRTVWAVALGALLVFGIGFLYWDVGRKEADLAGLRAQYDGMGNSIKTAETALARANFGRTFFQARPPRLEVLREVTMAFREEEPIWATSLSIRDDGGGTITGRASNQGIVLTVLDRLKENPSFSEVKLLDLRDAGGQSRDQAFSIGFKSVAAGMAAALAAPAGGTATTTRAATAGSATTQRQSATAPGAAASPVGAAATQSNERGAR